jgi:hypothetical protein
MAEAVLMRHEKSSMLRSGCADPGRLQLEALGSRIPPSILACADEVIE